MSKYIWEMLSIAVNLPAILHLVHVNIGNKHMKDFANKYNSWYNLADIIVLVDFVDIICTFVLPMMFYIHNYPRKACEPRRMKKNK